MWQFSFARLYGINDFSACIRIVNIYVFNDINILCLEYRIEHHKVNIIDILINEQLHNFSEMHVIRLTDNRVCAHTQPKFVGVVYCLHNMMKASRYFCQVVMRMGIMTMDAEQNIIDTRSDEASNIITLGQPDTICNHADNRKAKLFFGI